MFGVRSAVRTTLVPKASNRLANRAPSLASRSTTSTSGWMSKVAFVRLLRTPVIGRRPGDCSMHDSPSLQIEQEQDEDRAEEQVEGLREVTSPGNVVARKVLQRWPSPGTRFFMYRCTVRFETRIPSLCSSPRSRSAPHLGFRAVISRINVA